MRVQNEMATRISIDAVGATHSLKGLSDAVRGATNAWKAQVAYQNSVGNSLGAAKAKYEGLGNAIDQQKNKINELRNRQKELNVTNTESVEKYQKYQTEIDKLRAEQTKLDTSTKEGKDRFAELSRQIDDTREAQSKNTGITQKDAEQYLKLDKQISQSENQLRSYEAQQKRAAETVKYYESGLAGLQKSYKQNNEVSKSFTERLKAEGKSASATVNEYKGLQNSLKNLKSQYDIQEKELRQIEAASGKTSDAYKKQEVRLNETGKSIAETESKAKSMRGEFNKLQPTGIDRIDKAVVRTRDTTSKLADGAKNAFSRFKNAAIGASIGVATLGAGLIKGAKEASTLQNTYTENANLLITSGEKTAEVTKNISRMQDEGRKYSIKYGESQKTIAKGYQELIKRGYDSNQALGAMPTILKASKASGDDFSDTMHTTTSTLEAFGMKTKSVGGMMKATTKVANSMAMAADVTSSDFKSLGVGMSYVGTTAKNAGVSLDETSTAMGVLSNRNIEADKAGTGLRKVLVSLLSPTDNAKKAFKEAGINIKDFTDKSGNLKPIGDIFQEIGKKVPKGDKTNFFKQVFGTTGMQAGQVLADSAEGLGKNGKAVSDFNEQLKKVQGASKSDYIGELANKNMKSAQNQIKVYKQSMNAVLTDMGGRMLPAMSKATKSMTKMLESKEGQKGLEAIGRGIGSVANAAASFVAWIGKNTGKVKAFGVAIAGAFAFGKTISMFGKLSRTLQAFGVAARVAAGVSGIGLLVTAVAAIGIGLYELYKHNKKFSKFVNGLIKGAKDAYNGVIKWFKNIGKDIGKVWSSISKGASNVWKSVKKAFEPMTKGISKIWDNIKKGASAGWNAIKKVVDFGAKAVKVVALAPLVVAAATIVSIWNRIKKPTMAVWNWMKSFVGRIAKAIRNTVTSWFNSLKKSVTNIWNGIKNVTSAIWNPIKNIIVNVAKAIWSNVKNTFNSMKNGISNIWNNIKNITSNVWNAISGWLGKKVNAISKSVSGAFNGLKNSLSGILDSISKKWHGIWNGMASFFGNIWKSIKSDAKGGINGVIGWLNGGIGGINKVIHTFGGSKNAIGKIRKLAKGGSGYHGIAMVNDGGGEEAIIKNGNAYKVKGKNALVKFDGDETVIPHEASRVMFGKAIKRYANGSKNWFSKLTGWVKDKWDGLKNFIKHPIRALDGIMTKSLGKISGSELVTKLTPALGHGLVTGISSAFKKLLQKLKTKHDEADAGNAANPGGSGVKRWAPVIKKAAKKMKVNLTSAGLNAVLHRIAQESNGSPTITNNWDINAKLGHPSKGLLQYIQPTLSAWVPKGTAANLSSGYAQLVALFNDSNWLRDISVKGGWGPTGHKRFANGGIVSSENLYRLAEGNKPEYIIPTDISKRPRAWSLLKEVVEQFAGDTEMNSQGVSQHDNFTELKEELEQVNSKFDKLLSLFGIALGLSQKQIDAVKNIKGYDKLQQYKEQAVDQNNSNWQAI